jgi:L-threonylcarbamoyladenylate synthase
MKTFVTDSPKKAAAFIHDGGIVAFPTETVYGLGADIFNKQAIRKVFEAKDRPADNPLIAHVSNIEQVGLLAREMPDSAKAFIDAFFPGPLTIVLPKRDEVPGLATAGLDTVGVRMPGEKITHEFLMACGTPLVAPSANISGRPSPTTWQAVLEDLDGKIDCILKGEPSRFGLESTVVDCTGEIPVVLRPGAVSIEELRSVVPDTATYEGGAQGAVKSPGMKHRHYSPRARVVLVPPGEKFPDTENCGYIGINEPSIPCGLSRICTSVEEYAGALFDFFRECDRSGVHTVFCETVNEEGIGTALMDRLRRAAE